MADMTHARGCRETALTQLQVEAHDYSVKHGFWDHDLQVGPNERHAVDGEKIALMHSELSEALSSLRDGDWDHVEYELADTVLRIADYCEARGLSIARGIDRVQESNKNREHKHGRVW